MGDGNIRRELKVKSKAPEWVQIFRFVFLSPTHPRLRVYGKSEILQILSENLTKIIQHIRKSKKSLEKIKTTKEYG